MLTVHQAVMPKEVLKALQPQADGFYLDATLGGGTHSMKILEASAPDGVLLSLDVDHRALERARLNQNEFGKRWIIRESNFKDLKFIAQEEGIGCCWIGAFKAKEIKRTFKARL